MAKFMIPYRNRKISTIIKRIRKRKWRSENHSGGWYLYKMLLDRRNSSGNIVKFLRKKDNIELIYATLDTWGMNSRAAKLKNFESFQRIILGCKKDLKALGKISRKMWGEEKHIKLLKKIYNNLNVMESYRKLISNSKLLHFLFPQMLMPIDGKHTLSWLYGNTGESSDKYIEVIKFSLDVMRQNIEWKSYLSPKHVGNTTIPKLIDNVIWELED